MTNTYDRRGRPTTVVQGTNTTTLIYGDAGKLLSETCNGFTVTNTFDSLLRRSSLSVAGYSSTLTQYGYDATSRLQNVTNGNYTATYVFHTDSPLVNTITFKETNSARLTTTKNYDYLNRLLSISNAPSSGSALSFNYAYNSANQRTCVTREDSSYWSYGYDDLGQVTTGVHYWSDASPVAGQQFDYAFDHIGNRTKSHSGGDQWGINRRLSTYNANQVNQYTSRQVPGSVDILGTAHASASVTVDSAATSRKSDYFRANVPANNSAGPVYQTNTVRGVRADGTNDVMTEETRTVLLPPATQSFVYDDDGNLLTDGVWSYTWDAENRLITMTANTNIPNAAKLKLDFAYDYRSRRTWKVLSSWNGSNYASQYTNKFLYDRWNLIAEVNASNGVVRTFLWGTDLSGSLQGAGGVGGLLAVNVATNGIHFPAFDGNGNVTALVGASIGTQTAAYEFGPFGEAIRVEGTGASSNPIRFSSKYQDVENGLIYYGYRYHNPSTGRFLGRDPIAESGGFNLYAFVFNRPVDILDILGLKNYRIGSPTEPAMTFDESFVYDPKAHATAGDYLSWTRWTTKGLGAMVLRHDLVDAVAAYRHYLDGTGTDMEVDYSKAYRDDKNVRAGVNNEIAAAQADAERLTATGGPRFTMTGDVERLGNPATENWQKTIGQHYIWGHADVTVCADKFTMTITIHEKDRYNFNRGAHDIATGLPDDANGRFAVLGWAKSFITNGKVVKKVTWKKGEIGSTTKVEEPPRR
jgi:RHS repeat-associated protein